MPDRPEPKKSEGIPLRLMIIGVFALALFLLWGIACAMFDNAQGNSWVGRPTIGSGVVAFISNAIEYIPDLPHVVGYIFKERFWYVFVVIGVLGAVMLFAIVVRRVQHHLDEPRKRGIRSARRK